jgi:hypothetical protein
MNKFRTPDIMIYMELTTRPLVSNMISLHSGQTRLVAGTNFSIYAVPQKVDAL